MNNPVIVFNEDSDNVMRAAWHADPSHYTREELANYYSSIVSSGKVSHVFFCVNARCSAFPSKVAPNYWAALDDANMDHPQWLIAEKELVVGQEVDQFALGIDICRVNGASPWISFRMNDIHFVDDPKFFLNVGFWKEHPELWIDPEAADNGTHDWSAKAFDYRKEGVHDFMLAYMRETLDRYDVDGIELDWMRFEHHVPRSTARSEGTDALNSFTRKAKKLVEEFEIKRGHRIMISARVDSDPEAALNHGTDYRIWAKEELIDWLVACNFWATVDFELPVAKWQEELNDLNPDVFFLPGLDCGIQLPGQPHRYLSIEEYAAWGERMYLQGAKGAYFFNLFCQPGEFPDKREVWDMVTRKGFTPDTLLKYPKSIPANAQRECMMSGWL